MAASTMGVIHFLVRAITPVSLVAGCVGAATVASAVVRLWNVQPSEARHSDLPITAWYLPEIVGVILCALTSLLGVVAAVQMFRYSARAIPAYPRLATLFAGALVTLALPAVLWKTRLRLLSEGIATIALALASRLAGFSIGFLFVPLLLLMTWVCLRHLFNHLVRPRRDGAIAL
jgi:hypothetical protein